MDRAIGKEWTEWLRSGKITQNRKQLGRYDGRRCCLGVLCDIAVKHGIIPPPKKFRPNSGPRGLLLFDRSKYNLPAAVVNWAGLKTTYGQYPGKPTKTDNVPPSLATDNDEGADFNQLADTIEKHIDAL